MSTRSVSFERFELSKAFIGICGLDCLDCICTCRFRVCGFLRLYDVMSRSEWSGGSYTQYECCYCVVLGFGIAACVEVIGLNGFVVYCLWTGFSRSDWRSIYRRKFRLA